VTEQVLSLDKVRAWVDEKQFTCRNCEKTVLRGCNVGHYGPHDGGYHVEGFSEKRWVYVTCRGCMWSLSKLWRLHR
jgi:hypothetical protein